jgi:hypothetical protein
MSRTRLPAAAGRRPTPPGKGDKVAQDLTGREHSDRPSKPGLMVCQGRVQDCGNSHSHAMFKIPGSNVGATPAPLSTMQ